MAISVVVAVGDVGDELVPAIERRLPKIKVGPGTDPESEMGPLITREHRDKVAVLPRRGRPSEGATVVADGRSDRGRRRRLLPRRSRWSTTSSPAAKAVHRRDLRTGAVGRAGADLRRRGAARERQPLRQRHGHLHPRRRRGPAVPVRVQRRHGRRERADPGAGGVLQLRRLEGVAVRRHPHVRAGGRQLLHARQGGHEPLARPGDLARSTSGSPARADARTRNEGERHGLRRRPADEPAGLAGGRAGPAGRAARLHATRGRSTRTCCGRSRSSSTARSCRQTHTHDGRADGHQPGHPRLDGDGVAVRHAQRDVRQPHGLRHRPGRLGGAGHQRRARPRWPRCATRSTSSASWPTAARSSYKGSHLRFPWGATSRLEVWVAAYGPKALALTGEVGDGFILQLADPDITAWSIKAVREAAEQAGRDPAAVKICVAAPGLRRRRPGPPARPVPLVRRHGGQPRRRHRRPLRRGRGSRARRRSPTTSRAARTTTTTSTAGPATPTRRSCPTSIVDRFCILGPARGTTSSGSLELKSLGVDQFAIYLQHDAKESTLQAYGEQIMPAVAGQGDGEGERPGRWQVERPREQAAPARRLFLARPACWWRCVWEGYKALGQATDGTDPRHRRCRPAPTTRRCPTCGTSLSRFGDPERRGADKTGRRSSSSRRLVHVPAGHGRLRHRRRPSGLGPGRRHAALPPGRAGPAAVHRPVADRAPRGAGARWSSGGAGTCRSSGSTGSRGCRCR